MRLILRHIGVKISKLIFISSIFLVNSLGISIFMYRLCKVTRYKGYTQDNTKIDLKKSIVCLHTRNKQSEDEIKKSSAFIIALELVKSFGTNLTKEV